MSEGAAFNAHWNTPMEAMNGTIDLADAYYCKDGKPTTYTKIAELNNEGGLDVSKPNPCLLYTSINSLFPVIILPVSFLFLLLLLANKTNYLYLLDL